MRGNATCILSKEVPTADNLQEDADYDVYIRSQKTPDCEADRLFSFSNGGKKQMSRNMTTVMPTINFMNKPFPMQPSVVFQSSRSNGDRSTGSTINQRWFPTNDDDFRSYDIERNKNQKSSNDKSSKYDHNHNHFNQFDKLGEEDENSPIFFDKYDYSNLFGQKIGTIQSTKDYSGTAGFSSFSIGKNLFPSFSGSQKPIVQQSYLTISGKANSAGNKALDFGKPVYTEVPFVTKSLYKPSTQTYGFVIEQNADKRGYSRINPGVSNHQTDTGLRSISVFEIPRLDRAKPRTEDDDDNGLRFKSNSHSNRGLTRYSPPLSVRREPENYRFRQTAQLPDTSVFKYLPERSYSHYAAGENDGGHGISFPKSKFII